jgi:predicted alpha/beta superfamily hydrolase
MKQLNCILTSAIFCAVLTFTNDVVQGQGVIPTVIEATQKHSITSAYNNKTYQLYVSLPQKYSAEEKLRYPVLYVLDGRFSFNAMRSIREGLNLGKEIKDVIIVAIDGSSQTDADWFADRYDDFTPSSILQADTLWSKIMNIPEGKLRSGGARSFLNTLQKQMIPFIDMQYNTTADRGLSGHSLGGLFVGYCLLTEPALFNRYGINSPAFWWNNSEMLSIENSFAKNNSSLSANVFFSVGALEGEMMIAPVTAFMNALKNHNYNGLTITSQTFEGETHLSVVPACSSRTLKVLYGPGAKMN